MAWYYYYCHFGPGHQSREDGFKEFPDDYSEDMIKDHLYMHERFYDVDNPVIYLTQIKHTPLEHVKSEIKCLQRDIKYFNDRLKSLQDQKTMIDCKQAKGPDPVMQKALTNKILYLIVPKILKLGIGITYDDICNWKRGLKRPIGKHRKTILGIIRKSKSYGRLNEKL